MGLHNVWINQDILSIKLGEIKTRITDIYKQNWYACINNSRRLETYSLYKHEFELKTYLENISKNKFRIAITKFRLSSHNLAIEQGRHEGTPVDQRICLMCHMGVSEKMNSIFYWCVQIITINEENFFNHIFVIGQL